MVTWFCLPKSKIAHLLLSKDIDYDRFPLGKALCMPMERKEIDSLYKTNEINSENFCTQCVKLLKERF